MRRIFFTAALITACVLQSALAQADVRLPAIISDNMVIQAGRSAPIWGTADPGEPVTVTVDRQSRSTTADAGGRWLVKLNDLPTGGPETLTVSGHNTITIQNVLIGSVWICSGQSNMEFGMAGAHNAATEIPKASYPRIRLFTVARKTALEPRSDVKGQWLECTPETVQSFSAVGYFFGRDLHQAIGVPVGLIHSSWGGTPAQAWTSLAGLQKDAGLQEYVDRFQKIATAYPRARVTYPLQLADYESQHQQWDQEVGNAYNAALKAWAEEARQAREEGRPEPPRPQPARQEPRTPEPPDGGSGTPTVLFNGMIAPLIPYAIEGVIWYQGESNAGKPIQYRTLFPRMITDWREKWGQGEFPFLYVQLASFMARKEAPSESNWAALREAQTRTLSLPRTGMAVIIDIGEADDIHPKDKMDVGHRLALAAQKVAFRRKLVSSGPLYDRMKVHSDRIRVRFKETGSGLAVGAAPPIRLDQAPAPASLMPGSELKGFAIAGEDRKWEWANAQIDGDSVVVWSDRVSHPVAVRYAWADNPGCNLYNREGLPASPFRTDDWPVGQ